MAQLVEPETLDLGVICSSPMLGTELIFQKIHYEPISNGY